jgi:hypothetical protein
MQPSHGCARSAYRTHHARGWYLRGGLLSIHAGQVFQDRQRAATQLCETVYSRHRHAVLPYSPMLGYAVGEAIAASVSNLGNEPTNPRFQQPRGMASPGTQRTQRLNRRCLRQQPRDTRCDMLDDKL